MEIRKGDDLPGGTLTSRERWNRVMHYQQVDYVSNMEFGYWDELKEEWMIQGHLPESMRQPDGSIPNRLVEEYFGIEQFEGLNPRIGPMPQREPVEIESSENKHIYRDGLGVLVEQKVSGTITIPHFLSFPIKDRATWEAFRDEFLDPEYEGRFYTPEELESRASFTRTTTNPVSVEHGSYIGKLRDWIGFENLAYLSVDDPNLLEEMVEHMANLTLRHLPAVLEAGWFDAASGWEDICFNSGPILSPRFFKTRIMPHMRPVMDLLRSHGVDVIWTDCDGNILKLIPLWLEVGLNCMFPFEVNAGNDPVAVKAEYGRDILIRGGFDKFVLHQGRKAILDELKRLEPTVAAGGFIPHIDHRCPAEVAWDDYCYYIWMKCRMLGWPEETIKSFPAFEDWRP